MLYRDLVELLGTIAEGIGVAVITVGSFAALLPYLVSTVRRRNSLDDYQLVRQRLGRTILLGLEFLVAGDIIRSVAVSPTFAGVGVLALIVIIRTFLSTALIVEVEGRWPWQSRAQEATAGKKPGNEPSRPGANQVGPGRFGDDARRGRRRISRLRSTAQPAEPAPNAPAAPPHGVARPVGRSAWESAARRFRAKFHHGPSERL